jgi:3-isopropylmalate dehydrogenase
MPKVAIIAGDGIGPEVVSEALKVLDVLEPQFGLGMELEMLPYGADHYLATRESMPPGEMQRLGSEFDAILVGALGDPRVPGNEHARDILLGMRFELDLFVNERPAVLFDDRLTPLKDRKVGDIDLVIFRENTEGLYNGIGGVFKQGTPDEVTIAEEVNTRKGVERIIRHAFEWARAHGKTHVTMADKANAIPAHMLWRRVYESVAAEYRDIKHDTRYIDAMAMDLVRAPDQFQVIVTGNLFGDILSDVASMIVGGLGMAPSANRRSMGAGRSGTWTATGSSEAAQRRSSQAGAMPRNPDIAMFEPVHGSAPPMAKQDKANPMAAILTLGMLLDHVGAHEAAKAAEAGVKAALVKGVTTGDVGGWHGTRAVGDWIADWVRKRG